MKFTALITMLICLAYHHSVFAKAIQQELSFNYFSSEYDEDLDNYPDYIRSFGYRYYLSPTDGSKGPYRELAFSNKSSYVEGAFIKTSLSDDINMRAGGLWVHQGTGIVLGSELSKVDTDFTDSYVIGLTAGVYLGDNFRLLGELDIDTDSEFKVYNFSFKSLTPNANGGGVEWHGGLTFSDAEEPIVDDRTVNVGAMIYFNSHFGLGGDYSRTSFEDINYSISVIEVSASYYLNSQLGITVDYGFGEDRDDTRSNTEDDSLDFNTLNFDLTYRF